MALIVTPGASNANSYATLIEADAYHDTRLHNAEWTAAGDATKEAALIWATRELDANFCWYGRKATEEQSLDWPRYGMYDKDGYSIDSDIVPDQVKNAEAELAFMLIKDDRTTAADPECGVKSAKIDTLSVEFDKTDRQNALPDSAVALIQEFGYQCGVGLANGSSISLTERV